MLLLIFQAAQHNAHTDNRSTLNRCSSGQGSPLHQPFLAKKCLKSRCQILKIIDTRPSLTIPGTEITARPCNYDCNTLNVNYLNRCKKCDSGKCIGKTSTIIRLCMNNHKKNLPDNKIGLQVARHFNKPDDSIFVLECVILKGVFYNSTDILIEEQTLIRKLKTVTHSLNHDLDFLTPCTNIHKWCIYPSTHTPFTCELHVPLVATLTSLINVHLLSSVDVVLLMKTAGVGENSGHCIHSIGLKCPCTCILLLHLLIYIYYTNMRYFVDK